MPLMVSGREIRRVSLIDDDIKSRESFAYPVEELELEYDLEEGPINDLDAFVDRLSKNSDAVICDHHLMKKGRYSNYNGAEVVSQLYKVGLPAILCTTYQDRVEELRRFRRYIPILLNPGELDTDAIARGFELCVKEMNGEVSPSRRPWRTLRVLPRFCGHFKEA